MNRVDRVRTAAGGDAVLVTSLPHVRWACGFSGSNALMLVTADAAVLFTDGRYTEQADRETDDSVTVAIGSDLVAELASAPSAHALTSLVVDGAHLTVDRHRKLSEALDASLDIRTGFLDAEVAVKDEIEIDALRRAQAITCDVFDSIVPTIGPGVSEQELAAEIVYQHMRRGASAMAFEPIVASGPHGALPHARPSSRTFRPGDMVVIDMGGIVDGYCADMTRTVAIGTPDADILDAYRAVEEAVQAGYNTVRAGVSGAELDRAARAALDVHGLSEYFTHSLGHGVGMQVHEWPRLSRQVDHTVPSGACITFEPGVYVPGRFGIRTEDLVVVRDEGAESLTPMSRDLVVV